MLKNNHQWSNVSDYISSVYIGSGSWQYIVASQSFYYDGAGPQSPDKMVINEYITPGTWISLGTYLGNWRGIIGLGIYADAGYSSFGGITMCIR